MWRPTSTTSPDVSDCPFVPGAAAARRRGSARNGALRGGPHDEHDVLARPRVDDRLRQDLIDRVVGRADDARREVIREIAREPASAHLREVRARGRRRGLELGQPRDHRFDTNTSMRAPSTEWRESIAADEEGRFAGYGGRMAAIQKHAAVRSGPGRALHRNQRLGFRATVEILDGLPAHARHGVFARPQRYEATVRLSNGSHARVSDKKPDVRGFALRLDGVTGAGALGAATTAQCFLFINTPTFSIASADEFMAIVNAAAKSPLSVLGVLIERHGFFGGFKHARQLAKGLSKPFAGFAHETFHTAAPLACGPYAVKLRLVPTAVPDGPAPSSRDWSADVVARLAKSELRWDLQAQFFIDEAVTPIEQPMVQWPEAEAPFVTVARVVAPVQDTASADGKALADTIEAGKFDPWIALAEHRPLGEIMRARKVAYFASQRERGAV